MATSAGLTFLSGWLSVKLPTVSASISISETFVFAGTLLFGPSAGTVLVVLDALVLVEQRKLGFVVDCAGSRLSSTCPLRLFQFGWRHIWPGLQSRLLTSTLTSASSSFSVLHRALLLAQQLAGHICSRARAENRPLEDMVYQRHGPVHQLRRGRIYRNIPGNQCEEHRRHRVHLFIVPLQLLFYLVYRWSTKAIEAAREKVEELKSSVPFNGRGVGARNRRQGPSYTRTHPSSSATYDGTSRCTWR